MESKMKNTTHVFREANLVTHLIEESQIKSKPVMSCSWRKKKRVNFLQRLFGPVEILWTFVFYLSG